MAQDKELKEMGNVAKYIRVMNFDSWKCYELRGNSFGSVKETCHGYGQKSTVVYLYNHKVINYKPAGPNDPLE